MHVSTAFLVATPPSNKPAANSTASLIRGRSQRISPIIYTGQTPGPRTSESTFSSCMLRSMTRRSLKTVGIRNTSCRRNRMTHLLTILAMESGISSPHFLRQHSATTLFGLLSQMIRYILLTCVVSHSQVVSRFVSSNVPNFDNYAWSSGNPLSTMTSLVVIR